MSAMLKDRLLCSSVFGSILLALCCFTPVLVLLLGAVGLASVAGWLDVVLLPALFVFLVLTAYALFRRKRS